MRTEHRTKKGLRNTTVALAFYLLSVCVTFLVRRYFISALGDEVQGLKSVIANFLGMINLAELGIGLAVSYSLYKPLLQNDRKSINEIISVQAWFYRRVAMFVSLASLVLLCFFPFIFDDLKSPQWYAYATFIVFLWEAMMSYLINYRAILFNADQRSYRLTINIQGAYIFKNILQLGLLYFFPRLDNLYLYFLLIEVFVSLLGVYILELMIQKDYPWLKPKPKMGKTFLKKHRDILVKTKQLFAHQLGAVALVQMAPILVLNFSSVNFVTYYGNYTILIGYMIHTLDMSLGAITSSVGNLVAEDNKKAIRQFFWEFLSLKHLIATIVTFGFYSLSSYLIPLWLNDNGNYILPQVIVLLLSLNLYLRVSRSLEVFVSAYGLFQDVWAPITEASINIGGGLLFGYLFYHYYDLFPFLPSAEYGGLMGILLGAILSLELIIFIWKPYFLFSRGFNLSVKHYWKNYIKYPLLSLSLIVLGHKLLSSLALDFSTIASFAVNTMLVVSVFSLTVYLVFLLFSQGMRNMSKRLLTLLFSRI